MTAEDTENGSVAVSEPIQKKRGRPKGWTKNKVLSRRAEVFAKAQCTVLEGVWERKKVGGYGMIYACFDPRQQFWVYFGKKTGVTVKINLKPDALSYWGEKIELEKRIRAMVNQQKPMDQAVIAEYEKLKKYAETTSIVEVNDVDFDCKPENLSHFFPAGGVIPWSFEHGIYNGPSENGKAISPSDGISVTSVRHGKG